MFTISPVAGSDKKWVVEATMFDVPESWGFRAKEFDSFEECLAYIKRLHTQWRFYRAYRTVAKLLTGGKHV